MMAARPLRVDAAADHAAEGLARRRGDQREVEVAGEQDERAVHESAVEQNRIRTPEAGVALAIPEQEARDRKENGERRRHDRVQLLTGVEATGTAATAQQPTQVVGVETLDLADRLAQPGAKPEQEQQRDQDRPA